MRNQPTPHESAQELLDFMKHGYGQQHVFERVDRRNFPHLDQKFYQKTKQDLIRMGFRYIADIEDVTISQINGAHGLGINTLLAALRRWGFLIPFVPHIDKPKPKDSTFIRLCLSKDGYISGACYHFPLSWLVRILQVIGLIPKGGKVIDFESELSDGSFVVTSNCLELERTADIPNIHRYLFPHNTSASELLNHHKQMLEEFRTKELTPVPMYNYEDMESAQHRQQTIKNRYRTSVGFITDEDIDNIALKRQKVEAERLKQAIKEIKPDH